MGRKNMVHFIQWHTNLNTGIKEIDDQHKGLVEIINLTAYAKIKDHPERLKEILVKLIDYTKTHFTYEEEHMQKYNYDKLIEHKAQHQVLIKQVINILESLKQGNKDVLENIFNILENWLLKHVKEQDKEYAYYYAELNRGK